MRGGEKRVGFCVYNVRIFRPERAKGTSGVTQNAQFILRGLTTVSGALIPTHKHVVRAAWQIYFTHHDQKV